MINLVILIALGVGLYVGYQRGIIRQVGSLTGMLIALLACQVLGDAATSVVASIIDPANITEQFAAAIIGNVCLFLIVWWGISIFGHVIHNVVKAIHLGPVNGFAGALFTGFEVLVVASILINLWLLKDPASTIVTDGGPIARFVAGLAPALLDWADSF